MPRRRRWAGSWPGSWPASRSWPGLSAPERLWRWCRRRPLVAGLGAAVAALVLFVTIAGPLVAFSQSRLRGLAEQRADEALAAQQAARAAQEAEEARRLEAEQAGYEASTKALAADQALVQSYLSQAENLRNLPQPGRQARALGLLKRASDLKHDTDGLVAKLRTDSAGLRPALAQFWRDQQPLLRTEAARWLRGVFVETPLRHAVPHPGGVSDPTDAFGHGVSFRPGAER